MTTTTAFSQCVANVSGSLFIAFTSLLRVLVLEAHTQSSALCVRHLCHSLVVATLTHSHDHSLYPSPSSRVPVLGSGSILREV